MKDITLIIPAKNEPNALPLVLEEIKKLGLTVKILIVIRKDDLATFNATKNYECEVLFQSRNGYGNAIVEGITFVKTEYCCIFYADGSTDPKYIKKFYEKLNSEKLDLIFGSRYEKDAHSYDDDFITRIGNFGFTFLGNFLMKLKLSDLLFTYIFARTNCLKEMRLLSDDYRLCIEIPYKAKISKLKYSTIPCIERKRLADKKKVKAFSDGLKILLYLLSKCLNISNR